MQSKSTAQDLLNSLQRKSEDGLVENSKINGDKEETEEEPQEDPEGEDTQEVTEGEDTEEDTEGEEDDGSPRDECSHHL